jgi:hypothetical protein
VREAAEAEDAMTVDRVVFWGDPRQHDAVERGTPSADLLEDQSLARADLEKTAPSPQEPLGQWECRFLPSGLGVQCDRYVCPLPPGTKTTIHFREVFWIPSPISATSPCASSQEA